MIKINLLLAFIAKGYILCKAVTSNLHSHYEESMKILKNTLYDSNYAEIPCCHLTKKIPNDLNRIQIEYEDNIKFCGKLVNRKFYVQSLNLIEPELISKFKKDGITDTNKINLGFGGPVTLDLLYELHQIWFEQGYKSKHIIIDSYADLIDRLGWTKSGKTYKMIVRHLEALFNIRVIAKNSLFHKDKKHLLSSTFYLFPNISNKQSNGKSIIVSIDDDYYNNIKNGCLFIIPFNKKYFYSLTPLEKRIALYLSKIFNPRRKKNNQYLTWNRDIIQFAKQMPLISTNPKFIKDTFRRTLKKLIENRFPFLEKFEIIGNNIKFICEKPLFFEDNIDVNKFVDQSHKLEKINEKHQYVIDNITTDLIHDLGDKESERYYKKIATQVDEDLIRQCLSESIQEGNDPKIYFKHLMKKYT